MTVTIESIRFLGPDIAVEKGIAKVKLPSADAALGARYTVVHARRDGNWIMVVGRDAPYVPGSNEDYLKDLEWLIGDWTLDAKDRPLRLHFEWMAQKNFIKNTYLIMKDGQATLTGGQIIGWNPKLGRIVSWHFDAQGGFGNDVWTKDGSKWVIEATGVFRDGSESSCGEYRDADRRQQLHLAIGEAHLGRGKPAGHQARQDRESAVRQVTFFPLTWSKKPDNFLKGVSDEPDDNQSGSWNLRGAAGGAICACPRFRRRPRRQWAFGRRIS